MNATPSWSTPRDVRAQAQRLWDDGRLLAARLRRESLFPFELRLRQPSVTEIGERFDDVRGWIKALEAGGKAATGHGYDIGWREINHRQLGRNRIPDRAILAAE